MTALPNTLRGRGYTPYDSTLRSGEGARPPAPIYNLPDLEESDRPPATRRRLPWRFAFREPRRLD